MCSKKNSENPDEMSQNAAFHQGLYCFLRYKLSLRTEGQHKLEISTCDPLKYSCTVLPYKYNLVKALYNSIVKSSGYFRL